METTCAAFVITLIIKHTLKHVPVHAVFIIKNIFAKKGKDDMAPI